MWLIATTITLFIADVRVMADEYSGTIVQKAATSSTVSHPCDVTTHKTGFFIRNLISPVYLQSSTVYCHSVTASDGTDRTQNKMYSAAAFHCTDRQCTVESTVDTVWC